MAWQAEVGASSNRATDYRDFLTKLVGMLTSQHVATVVINAAGTGYVVGDVLTLTHAGALLDAKFEVTSVGGSGDITGLRINCSGAFSNRIATAAINAGGTGYAVGDILELTTGTSREKAKVQVDTVSGGVITAISIFETGGSYSVAPTLTGGATRGVGPAAFAGDDAATVDVTMTGLIGTTGLSVTGGTGSSATVDITLAQTGWTVDDDASNSRNRNDETINSVTDEKEVVLVGDATGITNKPYTALRTVTFTDGLDTRYAVQVVGLITHNPALEVHNQVSRSNGWGDGSTSDGSYLLFPQNQANEVDFWIQADDVHFFCVVNENPTASTDDGRYMNLYSGFMDRVGTESESPYPFLVFGSAGTEEYNPSSANDNITSIAELHCNGGMCCQYFREEGSVWQNLRNVDGAAPSHTGDNQQDGLAPMGEPEFYNQLGGLIGEDVNIAMPGGPARRSNLSSIASATRASSSRRFLPTPGTTAQHFLVPLTAFRGTDSQATEYNNTTDRIRGQVRGVYWIYNADSSGSQITNFSEDYIEDSNGVRYRIFHNHTHTQRYQYIAVKEDV